jgi:hypothetical protein
VLLVRDRDGRVTQYTFRPLPTWPHAVTTPRRYGQFKASWQSTLDLLAFEIDKLDGRNPIIGAGFRESDLRKDGMPRSDRNQTPYMHPGVEISFDSRHGRLTYATDEFTEWKSNVRAIALSLEALRAVDRYGVSKRGQQYAGWAQLAAGGPDPERGYLLVKRAGSVRLALMAAHPDHGGDPADFADVQAYREREGDR